MKESASSPQRHRDPEKGNKQKTPSKKHSGLSPCPRRFDSKLSPRRFHLSSDFIQCLLFSLCFCVSVVTGSGSQVRYRAGQPMATDERVRQAGWWPTQGTPRREEYAGPGACSGCHSAEATVQATTPMARAYTQASDSWILQTHDRMSFRLGSYAYEIKRAENGSLYSVSDGAGSLSVALGSAFGAGEVGQTYVFKREGVFYESELSFFPSLAALDLSPGHPRSIPPSLEEALGRRMDIDETRRCFGCHTTASTVNGQFDPDRLIPGVACEACHGPGARHIASMKQGRIEEGLAVILNPAKLKPVESVDFCGACHRTWVDIVEAGTVGVSTARFPAYRLEESRCWGKGDIRITCLACHDPHQPLVRASGSYDSACLRCHRESTGSKVTSGHPGAACPRSTKDCVTCHMPKYEVPGTHTQYTDHRIRKVGTGMYFQD